MRDVIAAVGQCTLLPRAEGTHFSHLLRNIVYQQLSGRVAGVIHERLLSMLQKDAGENAGSRLSTGEARLERPFDESAIRSHMVTTEATRVLAASEDDLRSCGLSTAKIRAVHDLALHVIDGRLPLDRFERMPDEAIIEALIAVRGIGPWTAQMFLMFRLGRPDVLPVLDLGVRKGAQRIYRMRKLPDTARLEKVARKWHPWASVASWYCWRVLDMDNNGNW